MRQNELNVAIITHCFQQKYGSHELSSRKTQLFLIIFLFSAKPDVNIFYTILYLPFQAALLTWDFFTYIWRSFSLTRVFQKHCKRALCSTENLSQRKATYFVWETTRPSFRLTFQRWHKEKIPSTYVMRKWLQMFHELEKPSLYCIRQEPKIITLTLEM
jgi:hypothetical protein